MKNFKLMSILVAGFTALVFLGCMGGQPDTPEITPDMTSSQVEKAIDWNYCEDEAFNYERKADTF